MKKTVTQSDLDDILGVVKLQCTDASARAEMLEHLQQRAEAFTMFDEYDLDGVEPTMPIEFDGINPAIGGSEKRLDEAAATRTVTEEE